MHWSVNYSSPRSKDFFFDSCGSLFPSMRANAQWVIHGLSSTLIYTSELILCSTTYNSITSLKSWEFSLETLLKMG